MKTVRRENQSAKWCIVLRKGKEPRELSGAKHSDREIGGPMSGREAVKKAREDGVRGLEGGKEEPGELSMLRAGDDQSCSCGW